MVEKKLERVYTVPLRKEWLKTPKWRRTKKAVSSLKKFLKKHMKSEEIKLGKHVNEFMWKHGGKNPPHHVKVTAVKDDKGVVHAELEGHEVKLEEGKKKKEKIEEKVKKAEKEQEKEKKESKKKDKSKKESKGKKSKKKSSKKKKSKKSKKDTKKKSKKSSKKDKKSKDNSKK